jgi:hypothetical protein
MMRIYTYISLPGLIIHELMHIIFGLLSGYIFSISKSWTSKHRDGALSIGLEPINKGMNLFQLLMVPMAPLYFIIIMATLSIWHPILFIFVIYSLVTYFYSFPSQGDFEMMRYAKVYIKYNYSDPTFIRFMNAKKNGVALMLNIPMIDPED